MALAKVTASVWQEPDFAWCNMYHMAPNGCVANGLNWGDGLVPYHKLANVVKETVAGFAHVYSFSITKCKFLPELLEHPILDLEDFEFLPPKSFKPKFSFSLLFTDLPTSFARLKTIRHYTIG